MKRLRKLARRPPVLNAIGGLVAGYIRFVGRTTRWRHEPGDLRAALGGDLPIIMALWHGQHIFTPLAWPSEWPGAALVARHIDGEFNAIALEKLGFHLVRGSGAPNARGALKRGGAAALRNLLRTLRGGVSVTLTADVPKIGGVAGSGIVLLAKLSGRPIYPLAVATRWGIDLQSWDSATISLPFGRGAIVVGEKLTVPSDSDEAQIEEFRREIGRRLDLVHARAYELAGKRAWLQRNG